MATTETVETLSRGQKAAATRRANTLRKAEEAEAKAKADAEHLARLKKRAAANVIKTVPTKEARAKNLARIKREQAEAKAEAKAKAEALAAQLAVKAEEKAFGIMSRHELRALAVAGSAAGEVSGRRYTEALARDFGNDWHDFKRADIDDTNHGKTVAALFVEQGVFFDNFKSNHAALVLRGVRKGKAQPARYWGLFRKYNAEHLDQTEGGKVPTGPLSPLAAYQRDVPTLYIRANGHADFDAKGAAGEKLRTAAFKLGEVCKLILTAAQWSDVQAKADAKAAERAGK